MTQGCNNIVISWLYWTCWNNLATSTIISTRLLQVVHSLFQNCWQLGTSSANTTCWRLVFGRLATRCETFPCVQKWERLNLFFWILKLSRKTNLRWNVFRVYLLGIFNGFLNSLFRSVLNSLDKWSHFIFKCLNVICKICLCLCHPTLEKILNR